MSDTITDGIRVRVKAAFWPERSSVEAEQWAFTYTITISNEGTRIATLRTREWFITDATGHVEEVKGPGVVGKQPRLEPGQSFEYTSWAMLKTPFGTMRGSYQLEREDRTMFDAVIGQFSLAQPNALN
jgi:ApaG protein